MNQLAGRFLLHPPDCALVQWYRERTGAGRNARQKLIVAPARRLPTALWRFVARGLVPEGAVFHPARSSSEGAHKGARLDREIHAFARARRSQKSSRRLLSTAHRRAMMALAPLTVQRRAALPETCAGDVPAASLDDAAGNDEAHGPEPGIVHARAVGGEVLDVPAGLLVTFGMAPEGGDHLADAALVKFLTPLPGPLCADLAAGSVHGLGDLEEVALGMETMPNSA